MRSLAGLYSLGLGLLLAGLALGQSKPFTAFEPGGPGFRTGRRSARRSANGECIALAIAALEHAAGARIPEVARLQFRLGRAHRDDHPGSPARLPRSCRAT